MTPPEGAGHDPLIVALDLPALDEAVALADLLRDQAGAFKVGLELFGRHGPAAATAVGAHGPVFLDLKLHDIPTTVRRATRQLARLGLAMLTVHALGGPAMLEAAVVGAERGARDAGVAAPAVLGVTLLTSLSPDDLRALALPPAAEQVPRLAALAVAAGVDGVVCAPRDLAAVRDAVGAGPLIVTPGVRPAGGVEDDHARAATPAVALRGGATHLVIGRPITRAQDPVAATRRVRAEIRGATA